MGSSSKGAGYLVRRPHVTFLYPPGSQGTPPSLHAGSFLEDVDRPHGWFSGLDLYGLIIADPIIAIANTAGAGLAATVLAAKSTRIGEN